VSSLECPNLIDPLRHDVIRFGIGVVDDATNRARLEVPSTSPRPDPVLDCACGAKAHFDLPSAVHPFVVTIGVAVVVVNVFFSGRV